LTATNTRNPFYGVVSKQTDAATAVVRSVEEYLNQPHCFVIPTRVTVRPIGEYNERALGIARIADRWRIVVYVRQWNYFTNESDDDNKRETASRRKPWLECGLFDKFWTLKAIPELLNAFLQQVEQLGSRAAENDKSLDDVVMALRTVPT
jgi:hypothetical protein